MDPVRFEPVSARHLAEVRSLLDDPSALRFSRVPEPVPDGYAERLIEWYEAGWQAGTHYAHAALDEFGDFVGLALVPFLSEKAGQAELDWIATAAARARDLEASILSMLTVWAFWEEDIVRAQLMIHVENEAAERVAERCGYNREGVMRSVHFKQGRRMDAGLWARLAGDP